jgi:hypothetical protein
LQPLELTPVELRVARRIEAHERLHQVGVDALDVLGEVVSVLELELRLTGPLRRHRRDNRLVLGELEHLGPELLVDEEGRDPGATEVVTCTRQSLEDQPLRLRDPGGLRRGRFSGDSEQRSNRPAVIKSEHKQG